jgi:alkylation response protein AidB-like acyl-CoA dehydrogenase
VRAHAGAAGCRLDSRGRWPIDQARGLSDIGQRHAVEAVQIFGALGVHHSSRVQRLFRDSKALQIFDGTSEIHTLMIGRDALNAHR